MGNQIKLVFSILLLFLAYQNCGRIGFQSKTYGADLSSLGVCEGILKEVYSTTYFPLLSDRSRCNRCHSDAHGSSSLDISFSAFMEKGVATIDRKATQPHGDNGLNLTSEIASIKPQWYQAEADYNSCKESGGAALKVEAKVVPNLAATQTNQTLWQPIEWDLETEAEGPQLGKFSGFLKIEVRLLVQAGTVIGLSFRNPSLRLKNSPQNIKVQGLKVILDDELQSDFTAFTSLSKIVDSTTETLLADKDAVAPLIYMGANASTLVGLEISNIQLTDEIPEADYVPPPTPTGTPVTFTQLTSTDPILGVFRAQCFSCHTGATPRAGLDLSNFQMAQAKASEIVRRTHSTDKPMPPTGPIPQAEKDIILRWTNNGTPQ